MVKKYSLHSSDLPFFLKGGGAGGVNFYYLPRLKIKKGGGSMVQGQVFLKSGLTLFQFNFFEVYHFYL